MFVRNFRVVNDAAENAVQMATDFTEKIMKDETQCKFLFVTVAQEGRDRSDLRRKMLEPIAKDSKSPTTHGMALRKS